MKRVLFICVHNSARSQMSEEYLRLLGGDKFIVASAGYKPTSINPMVVEVMKEEGIDLSNKKTRSVMELFKENVHYGYIISVCKRGMEENCPTFPGVVKRLFWDLENPEDFTGTYDEKLEKVRILRNKIKQLVLEFIEAESSNKKEIAFN